MKAENRAAAVKCSRCAKLLRGTALKNSIHCTSCGRHYHKKCFMAECGAVETVASSTSTSCVCCLSALTNEKKFVNGQDENSYAAEFLLNGFCVVPLGNSAAERERVVMDLGNWRSEVESYFDALLKTYECQAEFGHSVPTLESGYANFRQRCPGRFEIIADFITSSVVPLVQNSKTVQQTLDYLLCNPKMKVDKKLMSSGCFLSLMGSETQNYHTDGPALSEAVDLFPYAINVFVPLVPVDSHNGTEFVPGTQIVGQGDRTKSVRPSVAVGDALLFDYRVIHRGLRNAKPSPRPCYYATYSQSWYKDTYNFSESRYKRELVVSPDFLETRNERMAKRSRAE